MKIEVTERPVRIVKDVTIQLTEDEAVKLAAYLGKHCGRGASPLGMFLTRLYSELDNKGLGISHSDYYRFRGMIVEAAEVS